MAHNSRPVNRECAQCHASLRPYYLKDGLCGACRNPESVVVAQPYDSLQDLIDRTRQMPGDRGLLQVCELLLERIQSLETDVLKLSSK